MQPSSPLFLCGHAKSGTTLLLALLDRHPDLMVFPEETIFLRRILGHPEKQTVKYLLDHTGVGLLRQAKINDRHGRRDYSSIDFPEFEQRLRKHWQESDSTERSLLESVLLSYGEVTGQVNRKYWVEKTPNNETFLDRALAWWPCLKAIYIIRDPRDNFASYRLKRLSDSRSHSLEDFIISWSNGVHAWEQFSTRSPNGLLIYYDELVQRTRVVMQQICDFLQIDWNDILLQPTRNGVLWPGNSMYGTSFLGVSANSIGKYRDLLEPEEIRYLETWLGPLMARYRCSPARRTYSVGRMIYSLLTGRSDSVRQKYRMIRTLWRIRSSLVMQGRVRAGGNG